MVGEAFQGHEDCYDPKRRPTGCRWRSGGDQTDRVTEIELVLVDISTDSGLTGTCFSYTLGLGGRATEVMVDRHLAPRLVGARMSRPLFSGGSDDWISADRLGRVDLMDARAQPGDG